MRIWAGLSNIAVLLLLAPGLDVGVQPAYEEGRKTSESDLLRSLLVRLCQHTDSGRGARADLRLNVGLLGSGSIFLGAFAQATWASSRAVQSFYADGNAGSGLLHTSLGLLGSYDFARHWSAVAGAQARRLHGDAARSPITENEASYSFNAGLAKRL
jgi:outer membrane scaffolding protein for murein synthesis (MipA/OmpV family)